MNAKASLFPLGKFGALFISFAALYLIEPTKSYSQVYQTWRSEANSDSWQGNINWWKGSAGGIEFGQQEWNNNHYTTQWNNNGGNTLSTWRWLFQSGANQVHTFNGNAVRFFDYNGSDPAIINQSSATHIFNMALNGDGDGGDPLNIQIDNNGGGGFTFNGTFDNRGSDLRVIGSASSGATVTFAGVVSGGGGFYKENSNITVVMSAANTYSGQTTIQAGTVSLSSSGSLASSNIKLHSGGTLNVTANATVNSVAEFASGNAGVVSIGSGATLTVDGADLGNIYQNNISGSGGLTVAASGTTVMNLYGTQSYSGATTVTGGTLATSVALSSTSFTVNGGTFSTSAGDLISNSATVSVGGGTFTVGGNDTVSTFAITSGTLGGSSTLTATSYTLSGGTLTGNLGTGTATASTGTTSLNGTLGANLTVNGGTVNLGSADRISNSATVEVSSGTLGMGANNDTVSTFTLSGTGTLGGSGTLTATTYTLSGGTLTANLGTGTATASTGTTSLNGTLGANLTVNGGTVNLGSADRISNSATVEVSSGTLGMGANNDTVSTFTLSGTGTLGGSGTLTATSYALQGGSLNAILGTGGITVSTGTTTLGSAGRLNTSSTLTVNSGQLSLGGAETVASLAGSGGTLALGGNAFSSGGANTSTSYSGVLTGTGTFTKTGTGTLTMGGNSTGYTGKTAISGGAISVSAAGNLGANPSPAATDQLTLSSGGKLNVTETFSANANAGITIGTGGGTVDVSSTKTFTQAGGLYGSAALAKDGAGTLILTNTAGTYSGTISINAGTLRVNANHTSAKVTIANGGTLAGTATLSDVTVNSGGTLSPGNSPGTLTVGNVTFAGGGNYNWQIYDATGTEGTGYDLMVGTSLDITATTGNKFNLNLWSLSGINPDTNGAAINFANTNSYTWTIGRFANGITNFSTNVFSVNTAPTNNTGGFANTFTGSFEIATTNTTNLILKYTAASSVYNVTVGGTGSTNQGSATGGTNLFTGASALNKLGSGTLVMTNAANDYTGVTTIQEGTISIVTNAPSGSAGALGNAISAVLVGDSATSLAAGFDIGAANVTNSRNLTVVAGSGGSGARTIGTTNTTGTAVQAGGVTFNTAATLNAASGGTMLYSGLLSGTGNLTISNSGTSVFSASNDYTGTTTILTNATLRVAHNNALGTTAANTVVNSGGTLALSNGITTSEALNLSGTGVSNGGALRNVSGNNTVSGAVTLAADTRINADAGTTLTLTAGITGAGQALTLGGAGNITISAISASTNGINTSTSGSLTVDSTGEVTISAAGNYTGKTIINSGVLSVFDGLGMGSAPASAVADQITINNGATLNIINTGSFTLAANRGITLGTGGGRIGVTNAVTVTYGGIIAGAGNALTKLGQGTLSLSGANTFSGGATISAGTVILGNNAALGSGTVTLNGGALNADSSARTIANNLALSANSAIGGTGSLAVNGTTTLTLSSTLTNNNSGGLTFSNVTLGNSAVNRTLTLRGTGNTTFGGVIANSSSTNTGSLDLGGSGIVTLSGANTYSGTTDVGSGTTVRLGNASALGTTAGGTTIASGGALDLNGQTVGAEAITAGGSGVSSSGVLYNSSASGASLSGAVTLSSAATIATTNGAITLSGAIGESGSRALTKTGTGTLTLSGANTFSGGVTLSAGTLVIGNNAALGTGTATLAADVTLNSDSSARSVTNNINFRNLTVGGTGALTLSGTLTQDSGSYSLTNNLAAGLTLGAINLSSSSTSRTLTIVGTGNTTVTGVIANGSTATASAVTLNASGTTLTLGGANTYGGATTITAGTLVAANNTALGDTNGTTTVADGAALAFSNNVNSAEAISITGSGVGSGGAIRNLSGNNTNTGTITMTGSARINSDTGNLQLGSIAWGNNTNNLTVGGAGTTTITGGITGTATSSRILKDGAGALVISNNGSTGDAQMQVGNGKVTLAAGSYSTNTGTGTRALDLGLDAGDQASASDTAFYVNGGVIMSNSIYVAPAASGLGLRTLGTESTANTATFNNEIYLGGDLQVSAASGGTALFSGNIVNNGALTKIGAGTVTLSGTNTFSGNVTVSAGTLSVSGGSAVNDTNAVSVSSGATLDLAGGETVGSIAGAGNITLNANQLIAGQNNSSTTFSGVMSSSSTNASFVKKGTGTLTLSGANTMNGQLYLVAGTTRFDVAQGSTFTNTINLGETSGTDNATLTLGGTGLTFSNPVNVRSGSSNNTLTIASLNTSGTNSLTTGAMTLNRGASFDVASGGTLRIASAIGGTGGMTLTGQGTVFLDSDNTFTGGIVVNSGTLAINGTGPRLGSAGSVTNAAALTLNGGTFQVRNGFLISGLRGFTIGANGGTIDVVSGQDFGGPNIISGPGNTLTKTGAGTLYSTAANTIGGLIVSAGTFKAENVNALQNANVTLNGGNVTFGQSLTNFTFGGLTATNSGAGYDLALTNVTTGAAVALTVGNNDVSSTYAGVLSGAGSLVKAGTGTFIATGANTYTGTTTINAGILEARHSSALGTSAGATTVASGAQLKVFNNTGDITLADNLNISGTGVGGVGGAILSTGGNNTISGTITLQANSRIAADTSGRATSSLSIGAVDASGGAYVIYFGANGANISATGAISGAGGTQDGTTTSIFKDGANVLTLTGANTFTGDTRISAGKITVGAGGSLGTGSDVFIASGGTLEVNANTTVASLQEWANNNGGTAALGSGATLTINGNSYTNYMNSISGAGSLTKSGTGIMNLYGTQSYTGTTTVSGGTLATGTGLASTNFVVSGGTFSTDAANRLVDSAAVSVSSGNFNLGGNDTVGSFTITGGTLGGSSTLTASTYALQGGTVNAALGAGTITVSGGTTTLGSAGRFSGSATLVINGGQLTLGGDESVAAFSGTGGTLALGANNLTVNSGANSSFSGSLTGSGTLRTTGAGVLTLSGNNSSYTGATWISAGSLSITNANSLGSGSLRLGSGSTLSTLVVNSNATIPNRFEISDSAVNAVVDVASGQTAAVSGVLSQTNGTANTTKFRKDGAGTLVFNNANGTYNGQIQVGQGSIIVGATGALGVNTSTANRGIDLGLNVGDTSTANNVSVLASNGVTVGQSIYVAPNTSGGTRTIGISGSGTATFSNEIYMDGNMTIDSVASGNTVNVSGKITQNQTNNTAAGIVKNSEGTATLSGANDYRGNTTINAGVLQISAANNLGATTNSVAIASGATLRSTASLTNSRAITISSGTGYVEASSGTTNTLSGTLTKDGTKLVLGGGGTHVVNGSIVGTSANSDLIISNSTTTINTTNSYNGPTLVVSGGTLNNGINNALPTNTALTLGQAGETSGTTNTYNVSGYSQTVDSVATAGSGVNVVTNTTGTGNLTLNSSSAKSISNLTMGGANLTLTKAGANTVTLASGNNISASTIAIQQGTLLLGASNQIGNSTEINLAGGTLALGGNTDTVGKLTVSANSIFDFGTAGGSATTFTFSDFNTSAYGNNSYVMTINNAAVNSAIVFNFNYNGDSTFNSFATKVQFGGTGQFGQISFGGGAGALGTTTLLVAIPDARVYTAAAFLLVLIGATEFRRRKRCARRARGCLS